MTVIPHLLAVTLAFTFQTSSSRQISKICFTRGEFVYVKDMKTGVEKRLIKGSYPSLSPDGNTVAVSVDNMSSAAKDMSRQIQLVDVATGKVTAFPSLAKFLCFGASWSPDSSKLAFSILKDNNWEIAVMDAHSRDWQVLTNKLNKTVGVTLNSWTADSKSILCQDLDKIYQVGLNGSVQQTFPASDIVDDLSYISSATVFVLSSDGKYMLFGTDTQPDDKRLPMLWIYDMQQRKRTKLSTGRLMAYEPQWLGSDDEIIFTGKSSVGRNARPNIYRMHRDGSGMTLVVANAESPSFALALN